MLEIKPITLRKANEVIEKLHRHHKKARGCRFCLAVYENGRLCGVAIAGRSVARKCDFETVLEITRCATDGTKNAITKLYGAIVRASRPMGYKIVQTYILPDEGEPLFVLVDFNLMVNQKGVHGQEKIEHEERTSQKVKNGNGLNYYLKTYGFCGVSKIAVTHYSDCLGDSFSPPNWKNWTQPISKK